MRTSQSLTRTIDRDMLVRTGSLIAACTMALTAAFLGVVSLASGESTGVVGRFPLYVLAGAVLFVAALLVADHAGARGRTVLLWAMLAAVSGFVLFALGVEGLLYAVTAPEQVVASHLFVYLVSAAIIGSGLGYWGARNWKDVVPAVRRNTR